MKKRDECCKKRNYIFRPFKGNSRKPILLLQRIKYENRNSMIILIQCKDRVGLVAAISGLMAQKNINIVSMREFVDIEAKQFFARLVCDQDHDPEILLKDLHLVLHHPQSAFSFEKKFPFHKEYNR